MFVSVRYLCYRLQEMNVSVANPDRPAGYTAEFMKVLLVGVRAKKNLVNMVMIVTWNLFGFPRNRRKAVVVWIFKPFCDLNAALNLMNMLPFTVARLDGFLSTFIHIPGSFTLF